MLIGYHSIPNQVICHELNVGKLVNDYLIKQMDENQLACSNVHSKDNFTREIKDLNKINLDFWSDRFEECIGYEWSQFRVIVNCVKIHP